jgi:hypothetical protein
MQRPCRQDLVYLIPVTNVTTRVNAAAKTNRVDILLGFVELQ